MIRAAFRRLPLSVQRRLKHRLVPLLFPSPHLAVRKRIAARYIRGSGLEVGALHSPMPVPRKAAVRYIDRLSVEGLRKHYPELADLPLVHVDVLDNGEELSSIPDASVDFVIASHLIEHTENPIRSLENWLRVLRPGGILFLGVPHKEQTFDSDRSATSLEHLVRDYTEGPEWSRRAHYEEWVRLVNKAPEHETESRVQQLMEMDYSIHFHVWTEIEFLELLLYCQKQLGLSFSIEHFQKNGIEFIAVLRKQE